MRAAIVTLGVLAAGWASAQPTLYVLTRDGQVACIAGEKSAVIGRVAGAQAIAATPDGVAVRTGDRVRVFDGKSWRTLARGEGRDLFPASPPPSVQSKVPGTIRASVIDGGKLYAATREGPLWEVDVASGARRNLGLGGWWGTIALGAAGGKLYAVTITGKVWEIDPAAGTKTIVQMAGWENAIAIAAR